MHLDFKVLRKKLTPKTILLRVILLTIFSCMFMSTATCSRSGYGAIVKNRKCITPDAQPELDLIKITDRNIENIFETFGYRAENAYEFGAINNEWPTIGHDYLLIQKKSDSSCDYKFLTFTMAEKGTAKTVYYSVSSNHGSLEQINNDLKKIKSAFSQNGELWFEKSSLIELESKKDIIDFLNAK